MAVGLTAGEITIPVCTQEDESALDFDVTYSMSDLPSWLSFDATTRMVSLASGTTFPSDANTAAEVTYTCTSDDDSSVTASRTLTINDLDGGGVTDGKEYGYGAVPYQSKPGWIWLNPGNLNLNRIGTTTFKLPVGITKATAGMDPTDATDDTADFDDDTLTNLVEVGNGTNIFIALSDGLFGTLTQYTAGTTTIDLVVGDFNDDGYLDTANTNNTTETVTVLLNDGDGTFTDSGESPSTGQGAMNIATADFNGDGVLDLAVTNQSDDNVTVLLGDGDGTFTDSGENPDVGDGPRGITTADFDGDGNVDLSVANTGATVTGDTISILLGEGDGTFASQTTRDTGTGPYIMNPSDFNGDGVIDLAVSNWADADNDIQILLGDGDGTFTDAGEKAQAEDGPLSIVSGDFDGDGNLDLAVTNSGGTGFDGSGVSVLLGDGDGTFTDSGETPSTGTGPTGISTCDYNGDGYLDLVVTNAGTGWDGTTLTVLFGDGDGTFTASAETPTTDAGPASVVGGDFDNDGDIDLAVSAMGASRIDIFLNQ